MALTQTGTDGIKDDAVTLDKLEHGTSSNNGKFLRANNGAAPSFETIDLTALSASNLTSGTIPDARFPATLPAASAANLTSIPAGNLTGTVADARISTLTASKLTGALPAIDGSNLTGVSSIGGSTGADFNDDTKLRFGGSNQLEVFYGSSKGQIKVGSGQLECVSSGNFTAKVSDDENAIHCQTDGQVELYHNGTKKFVTTSTGARVENTSSPLTSANSNANDLVVSGDGASGITIHSTNTNQNTTLYFADGDSSTIGGIIYKHSNEQMRFQVDGGLAIQVNSDKTVYFQNTIYASGFVTSSDLTHKSNLVPFTNTLDKLKEVKGYTFDMKVGEAKDVTISSAGIIAQDVEKVFPKLVEGEEGGKTVQYNGLIGVLVEAVKELTTKVETLEAKVAALEAK